MPRATIAGEVEKKFSTLIHVLFDKLSRAKTHFDIWYALQQYRNNYYDELNTGPAFLGLTMRAPFSAALVQLSKLDDKQQDSMSIWTLLDMADKHIAMFGKEAFAERVKGPASPEYIPSYTPLTREMIKLDRQRLETLRPTLNNLKGWRDKVLAHIDASIALQQIDIAKRYPLKRRELNDLIAAFNEILNKYAYMYSATTMEIGIPYKSGLKNTMEFIRIGRRNRRRPD